jgi:hypothetical protein
MKITKIRKVALLLITLFLIVPIAYTTPKGPADFNGLNRGMGSQQLYLYEKDPTTWDFVDDGAWGKMNFWNDRFVFNGHNLVSGTKYALIYYPDPWPGIGILVLGTGTADMYGDVNIGGPFDFTAIPAHIDDNAELKTTTYFGATGAQIWLVLLSDITEISPVNGHPKMYKMSGWTPAEYLFEYDLINKVTYPILDLWEKDPSDWNIVDGGAYGKMAYSSDQFSFIGSDLSASTSFSLIYYPDPWPGNGLKVLGSASTDVNGDISISGDFDFTSIPIDEDTNAPGSKIWLVLSSDVGTGLMVGWNPTEYLFENNLI